MLNTNTLSRADAKTAKAMSMADLDQVVGGQAPTGTTGGGNVSIWAKIKSLAFGVDASFF